MSKKVIKVGINGFGRIGRNVFRSWLNASYKKHQKEDVIIKIMAINYLAAPKNLVHLLKYDSVHGKTAVEVGLRENKQLVIRGMIQQEPIQLYAERDPANIPWEKHDIDVVMDCTGIFRDGENLKKHMKGSVKKVVLSAPGKQMDGTFVVGVNDDQYDKDKHHIISLSLIHI